MCDAGGGVLWAVGNQNYAHLGIVVHYPFDYDIQLIGMEKQEHIDDIITKVKELLGENITLIPY